MKYIKHFENMESKLYQKVGIDALGDDHYSNAISMSQEYIDILLPLLNGYIPRIIQVYDKTYIQCYGTTVKYNKIRDVKYVMQLYDEYFIVSARPDSESDIILFKCDTIQGVLDLLKDKDL